MTRKVLSLVLILWWGVSPARANVLTVSNSGGMAAQYSNANTAINAASAGDTIYLHPSGFSYGDIVLNKPLTLLGPGVWPEANGGQGALVNNVLLDSGSSGSVISGLRINGAAYQPSSFQLWDITISYCHINGFPGIGLGATSSCWNWIIRNNLFTGGKAFSFEVAGGGALNNFLIANNIFLTNVGNIGQTGTQHLLRNNVIYTLSGGENPLKDMSNCLITDNIIYGGGNNANMIDNCEVYNNIFYGNYTEIGAFAPTTTYANNLMGPGANPDFVSAVNLNASAFGFAPTAPFVDLHLQPGGQGEGTGSLGVDPGLYTGPFPWMDNPVGSGARRYYPGARIPEVYQVYTIGQAAPDSQINVTVKGKNVN